jgi:hypothetical protein
VQRERKKKRYTLANVNKYKKALEMEEKKDQNVLIVLQI